MLNFFSKSKLCNLANLTQKEAVSKGEEINDLVITFNSSFFRSYILMVRV